jgi:hypothetical protein
MVLYNLDFFLDSVHRQYFNNITFRKLDLLPSSGKIGRTQTLAIFHRRLSLTAVSSSGHFYVEAVQVWGYSTRGPTARVSILTFLPEDERRSSFWNVILLKYRRWTMSKKQFYRPKILATCRSISEVTGNLLTRSGFNRPKVSLKNVLSVLNHVVYNLLTIWEVCLFAFCQHGEFNWFYTSGEYRFCFQLFYHIFISFMAHLSEFPCFREFYFSCFN